MNVNVRVLAIYESFTVLVSACVSRSTCFQINKQSGNYSQSSTDLSLECRRTVPRDETQNHSNI